MRFRCAVYDDRIKRRPLRGRVKAVSVGKVKLWLSWNRGMGMGGMDVVGFGIDLSGSIVW